VDAGERRAVLRVLDERALEVVDSSPAAVIQ
jgi:hypothetical protein